MLTHIAEIAKQRGCQRLRLETGSTEAFSAAVRLYKRFGFIACEPFGTKRILKDAFANPPYNDARYLDSADDLSARLRPLRVLTTSTRPNLDVRRECC
jgi:ribosomal protein S18 acetylase RimI-like enzyme